MLPPGIEAALIESGGCKHTPQPWMACDTCGRPIPAWVLSSVERVTAFDWQAVTIDGDKHNKKDLLSIDNVPKDRMAELRVATTSLRAPVIKAVVDPRKGEQIHMFTRHAVRTGFSRENGTNVVGKGGVSVVVLEVTPDLDRPDKKVYLYVHPHALILSTKDMYF